LLWRALRSAFGVPAWGRRSIALALVIVLTAGSAPAAADAPGGNLPELPAAPNVDLPKPEASDLAELDALLARITGQDDGEREQAVREVLEAEPRLVPALAFRLNTIADSADKEAMKRLFGEVRRRNRETVRDDEPDDSKNKNEKPASGPDYLAMVASHAEPSSAAFRDLASVLAVSRMLEHIGTIDATRTLLDVYVRFGEFLRIATQHALARLGDKAVPALIEARRHPAEKIRKWAHRQLDFLGKAIPSEAVQTTDHQVLADALRAFGRTRDPDAIRIVVSFANNERSQVREAARQAIALLGEVSAWQLRDTYENIVGKKPPRDWSWERTARELFAEFDRLRSAEVSRLFETGQKARKSGDLETMRASYDKLLAHDPEFSARQELAESYLEYARRQANESPENALSALRRAERLSSGSDLEPAARSLRLTLEAERLAQGHIADRTLLLRALELDPGNVRAKEVLARLERGEPQDAGKARYGAAAAIFVAAIAAIAVILFRRRPAEAPGEARGAENSGEPSD
jgi:hypothetical protein